MITKKVGTLPNYSKKYLKYIKLNSVYQEVNLQFLFHFCFAGASSKEDEPFEDHDDTKVNASAKGKKKITTKFYFDKDVMTLLLISRNFSFL